MSRIRRSLSCFASLPRVRAARVAAGRLAKSQMYSSARLPKRCAILYRTAHVASRHRSLT
eukprot:10422213-Alexandrium_andersonii.AAC.1